MLTFRKTQKVFRDLGRGYRIMPRLEGIPDTFQEELEEQVAGRRAGGESGRALLCPKPEDGDFCSFWFQSKWSMVVPGLD